MSMAHSLSIVVPATESSHEVPMEDLVGLGRRDQTLLHLGEKMLQLEIVNEYVEPGVVRGGRLMATFRETSEETDPTKQVATAHLPGKLSRFMAATLLKRDYKNPKTWLSLET